MTDRDASLAFLETCFAAYPNKQAWAAIIWTRPSHLGKMVDGTRSGTSFVTSTK